MSYQQPPVIRNSEGRERRVGLELEFAGIELRKVADIISTLYGGDVKEEHRYHYEIKNTEIGTFRVELDARILQKMARHDLFQTMNLDLDEQNIRKSIEDVVDKLAKTIVPIEIVMPPVPVAKLDKLERLRQTLQKNRAEGTDTSLVHAFGMHINVEVPELSPAVILRYLRAFIIVYPWLLERLDIDISRRLSPFVDPFPEQYAQKVLDPSYQPPFGQMIEDYVEFNDTRNRPLDLMPVFGMINNRLIRKVMEDEKNDPRPTFHYRLPNSRINDPEWRFEEEWNNWLVVEELASDSGLLEKLSRLYLLRRKQKILAFRKEWASTVRILLELDEKR